MGPDISSENPLALPSCGYVIKKSLAVSTVFVTDFLGRFPPCFFQEQTWRKRQFIPVKTG